MGGVSAQVHSIRKSCSRKRQVRGGAGMECHRPDEKPQEGSITMLSSSSSSFSHSSSSRTLRCPPLGTEGVKKVMGEAQLPSLPSSPPPPCLTPCLRSVAQLPSNPLRGQVEARQPWGGERLWSQAARGQSLPPGLMTLRELLEPLGLFPLLSNEDNTHSPCWGSED